MSTIEPSSSGSQPEFEQRFWEVLLATMQTLFPSQVDAVERYKNQLDDASPAERLLALHDDPIDVAATLTGSAVTPEMLRLYDALLGRLDNFSRRFEPDIVPAETTTPVTLAHLDLVLKGLGFTPVPRRPRTNFVTWKKSQRTDVNARADLPEFITILGPQFNARGFSEAVYDRDHVVDLITHLTRRNNVEGFANLRSLIVEQVPQS